MNSKRRHDVDWLRVIALMLLIFYHACFVFHPQGGIRHQTRLEWLEPIMSLLNVWRIPILFMISGMGVRFAMERRDWKQLALDRLLRLMLPFYFGWLVLNRISSVYIDLHKGREVLASPSIEHLWFLNYIFLYFALMSPLLWYLKKHPDNAFFDMLTRVFRYRLGLFIMAVPFVLEVVIINLDADKYPAYLDFPHGWLIGGICFLTGFVFVALKDAFWQAVPKTRWIALALALGIYLTRVFLLNGGIIALTALESYSWMLALFGFASLHLNQRSRLLTYLSNAVYPVYIVHLPVHFVCAYYIVRLPLPPESAFVLQLLGVYGVSFLLYEIIRRVKWIRPLFGMKFSMPG